MRQAGGCGCAVNGACGGLTGYVNPMAYGQWTPSRTDQGVDWNASRLNPVRRDRRRNRHVLQNGRNRVAWRRIHRLWPDVWQSRGLVHIRGREPDGPGTGRHGWSRRASGSRPAIPGGPETEWGFAAAPGTSPVPATPLATERLTAPRPQAVRPSRASSSSCGAKPLQPPGPGARPTLGA